MAKKKHSDEGNSYCRNWAIELYDEWENINDILMFIQSHYSKYVYILHDSDVWTVADYDEKTEYCNANGIQIGDVKKLHYHVAVQFDNPRYRYTIAKELNIDNRFVQSSHKFNKFLKYLVHWDEIDKHKYSLLDLKGPLSFKVRKLCNSETEVETSSEEIRQLILAKNYWNLNEFLIEINKRGLYSVYRQGYTLYKDLIIDHNSGVF